MHSAHITRLYKCLTAMGDRSLSQLTCLCGFCLCFAHSNFPGTKNNQRQGETRDGARNTLLIPLF